MDRTKTVRNSKNMTIGWLREFPDRIIATHYRKGVVGMYLKGNDSTIEFSGKLYCYGDGTQTLIREADKEYN